MALDHWLRLTMTEGLGPILTQRLIESCGSAQAACAATVSQLEQIQGIGTSKAAAIHKSLAGAAAAAEAEILKAAALGIALVCPDDAGYPALLRSIPDPPPVLYVQGALKLRDLNAVAIVGSRKCSYYGREQAERFAAALAGVGLTVVSGGARGTDAAAHRGALSHPQGRTIAVLGSGLDRPYPEDNLSLFQQIAARGALISEFPLGTAPLAENFPRRNRIISGMSRGVFVIEAAQRSGALITARHANEDHNRPVFALPGKVDNPLTAGPHQLIRDGAVLVGAIQDILDNLGPPPQGAMELLPAADPAAAKPIPPAAINGGLTPDQELIVKHLGTDDATIDALIDRTQLSAAAVLRDLTFLTLRGVVRRIDGQTFGADGDPMQPTYDMIACFVVRDGPRPGTHEFLQLHRAPGQSLAGCWQTVAGSIEPGETASQAALRELLEETGLRPLEFYQLDSVNIFYLAARDSICHCPGFCALIQRDDPVVLNHEHDDYRWVDRAVVEEHFMWPGEHAQLRELCREILDDGPSKPHLRLKLS